jgi:hypothetical protein
MAWNSMLILTKTKQLIFLSLSQFATPFIIYKIWTNLGGTPEGFFSFFRH